MSRLSRRGRRLPLVCALFAMSMTASTHSRVVNDPSVPAETSGAIRTAIAAPQRSDQDRALDVSRKPAEFLAFSGIQPGDRVVEINAGGGYLARLLPTLVGDSGRVFATNAEFVEALFEGINERLTQSLDDFDNVDVSLQENDRLSLPGRVDVAILNNIYHDLHWQAVDLHRFNRSVFDALKPGGLFIVGDHSARDGAGVSVVGDIHRIERAFVVAEIESAGFELIASSNLYRNVDDTRELHVIDPAIRGETDRFLLKFRKPTE